jgi:hypothetical protein
MAKSNITSGERAGALAPNIANDQQCQFCHCNTYPRAISAMHSQPKTNPKTGKARRGTTRRQWTVADIAAEADHAEDHRPHIDQPLRAVCIAGQQIEHLPKMVDEIVKDAKQPNGKAIRKDTPVLLAAVYSLPWKSDDYIDRKEQCDAFFQDAMDWHEKTYGLKILNASLHLDEAYIHIHIFGASPKVREHVPGWIAKEKTIKECTEQGMPREAAQKEGNKAFKKAMSELQDNFWVEVGRKHGLNRFAPISRPRYLPGEKKITVDNRAHEDELLRKAQAADLQKRALLEGKEKEIFLRQQQLSAEKEEAEKKCAEIIQVAKESAKKIAKEIREKAEAEHKKTIASLMAGDEKVALRVYKENVELKREMVKKNEELSILHKALEKMTAKFNSAYSWLKDAVKKLEVFGDFSFSHIFQNEKKPEGQGSESESAPKKANKRFPEAPKPSPKTTKEES